MPKNIRIALTGEFHLEDNGKFNVMYLLFLLAFYYFFFHLEFDGMIGWSYRTIVFI